MRSAGALTAAGAALAMTVLLPAGPAQAHAVRCTDTVTTRVTLGGDLRCAGSGPVVAGPGGVLDLDGHRLVGSGTGTGVTLQGGRVEDGTVTRFGIGVGGTGTVASVRVLRNATVGIGSPSSYSGPFTVLDGSVTDNGGYGISTAGGLVEDSVIARNGGGILSAGTLDVRGSTIRANAGWGLVGADSVLRLTGSTLRGNALGGVDGDIMYGSTIRGNRFQDHPAGAGVDATFWTLEGTTISDNAFTGNRVGLLARVVGPISTPGPISGNRFTGNLAAGMWLEDAATVTRGTPRLRVVGNSFTGNGFASGGLVDRAGRPVDDGLHLDVAGLPVVVADNVALRNAGYGIEAHDDVVDGGGNTARRNGQPAQCLGVSCS